MYSKKKHKNNFLRSKLCGVLFLLLTSSLCVFGAGPMWAADEQGEYPDKAGREALRLWAERERDRSVAEAVRRYWDYWLSRRPQKYSSQRLWFELEQTQKWLKDPKHQPPPPPPPPPAHWAPPYYPPYQYPYPYYHPYSHYYPPPYYPAPQMFPPPPYYPYPGIQEKPGD